MSSLDILSVAEEVVLMVDNDISGGSFGIRQVKSTLSGAYQILQAKLFERAAQMSRKGWKARDEDPVELSLLTAVMGVTKEVCPFPQ